VNFESDPYILWSIRVGVIFMLAFVVALLLRVLMGTIAGRLDLADIVCGPSGRLSWKKLFGIAAAGTVLIAVLRDAADGTLSWELAAVTLGAAGLIDLGASGINVYEKIGMRKAENGHGAPATRPPKGDDYVG
jgi:hypothetical protein